MNKDSGNFRNFFKSVFHKKIASLADLYLFLVL